MTGEVKHTMTTTLKSELVVEVPDVAVLDDVADVQTLIDNLNEAKRLRKAADEAEAAAKAAVKALLGDHTVGTLHGVVKVELVTKERRGVDRELLETVYPEAFRACGTVTTYQELRTH
jgi:hypothetical protein